MNRDLDHPRGRGLPSLDPAGEAELSRRMQYAITDSFVAEQTRTLRASARSGWILSFVLIIVCGAQAAAIAILLPLKEVVPYTLLVDRQTGYIETVRGVDLGSLPEDEAVVHAFLAQYVLAREIFDPADFDQRYTQVARWSLDEARQTYIDSYRPDDPGGILAELTPEDRVSVTITAIQLSPDRSAEVRFSTLRRSPGQTPRRDDWRAVVRYQFSGAPMRMEDRLINPLGFQVLSYRRDRQTPADTPPAPVAPDAAAIPSPLAPEETAP